MIVPSGENFGKRTVSELIYFLSYAYFDIYPSLLIYETPSRYLEDPTYLRIQLFDKEELSLLIRAGFLIVVQWKF